MTAAWPPTRYSEPVGPHKNGVPEHSHGTWLLKLVDLAYRLPGGEPITLDQWQRNLILWALESYPPGHPKAGELVRQQVFVSVGRQNGKSVIGAILALYGLMRGKGQLVIGVASSTDQAKILYNRVIASLEAHPAMRKRFKKITQTRNIETADGSSYSVKPSKSAAVQGLDVSVGLIDELHIVAPALWSDLISGTTARRSGLVFGITTAGDDNSSLLLSLYKQAENPPSTRFGFAIWEASVAEVPLLPGSKEIDVPALTRHLLEANPALACGRLDLEDYLPKVLALPHPDIVRYRMNRFVRSVNTFITPQMWKAGESDQSKWPALDRPVFAVIASKPRDWFTVVEAQHIDGVTYARIIAQLPTSDLAKQTRFLEGLYKYNPSRYVLHRWSVGGLIEVLGARNYPIAVAANGDAVQASSHLYALLKKEKLRHEGSPVAAHQARLALRKNVGEEWRMVAPDGADIDVLYGFAFAAMYAEIDAQTNAAEQYAF